jgi:hypothetical protein
MGETDRKGNLAEMNVAEKFVENANRVSFPQGDGSPYDMIRDDGALHRVQVKHSRLRDGCIQVNLHTRYQKGGEWVSTTHDKTTIDEYAVYCPDTGEVYVIDVEEAPEYAMKLRVKEDAQDDPRINWAEKYEV